MNKKAFFFIDDVIWVFRDLTRQKPEKLFDNPFMNMLKTAHDKYGLKVQLNLFYITDSFYGYDEFCLVLWLRRRLRMHRLRRVSRQGRIGI